MFPCNGGHGLARGGVGDPVDLYPETRLHQVPLEGGRPSHNRYTDRTFLGVAQKIGKGFPLVGMGDEGMCLQIPDGDGGELLHFILGCIPCQFKGDGGREIEADNGVAVGFLLIDLIVGDQPVSAGDVLNRRPILQAFFRERA